MNETNKEIAIGLPVYNGELYLEKAIDSILKQSFKNFALIISDNASSDNTEFICQKYEKQDARIKYIRQPINIGVENNFQFVKKASSEYKYFIWAAHDDFWEINWLEELINNIQESDLGIRGRSINIDHNENFIAETFTKNFYTGDVLNVFMDNEKNGRGFYYYSLFNNRNLAKVNFDLLNLNKTYGADTLFLCHMIQFGNLRTIKSTSQYYRRHDSSMTNHYSKQWFGLKRFAFYLFPVSTYFYVLKVTNKKYWPILIATIPIKFIKSQIDIWPRIIRFLLTGKTI